MAPARLAVQRELDAIDAAASRFREDSELSRLGRAGGRRTRVSPLLMEALRLAIRAAEITDGAVDPTLGDCLVANGYDRDFELLTPVPARKLEPGSMGTVLVRRRRRWQQIQLFDDPPAVQLPRGVELDLGATAKALAADRAVGAAHRAAGGAGALVALGGDIATCGSPPEDGWMVRVTDDHRDAWGSGGQTIALPDGGLATSSVTARRWLHDGIVRHHILDPRDGRPVRARWRTVSVVAGNCADANIASTAAIVLGSDAPGWLEAYGLPARFVSTDGGIRTQGGWPQ
jgi:thiamine biosynthesis lipoprotein